MQRIFIVVKRYAKTPDFDAKLRPYTKNFYGSQKVCKKTPDFDAELRPYAKNSYGSQKV